MSSAVKKREGRKNNESADDFFNGIMTVRGHEITGLNAEVDCDSMIRNEGVVAVFGVHDRIRLSDLISWERSDDLCEESVKPISAMGSATKVIRAWHVT